MYFVPETATLPQPASLQVAALAAQKHHSERLPPALGCVPTGRGDTYNSFTPWLKKQRFQDDLWGRSRTKGTQSALGLGGYPSLKRYETYRQGYGLPE
jgi:hypothetical protein